MARKPFNVTINMKGLRDYVWMYDTHVRTCERVDCMCVDCMRVDYMHVDCMLMDVT